MLHASRAECVFSGSGYYTLLIDSGTDTYHVCFTLIITSEILSQTRPDNR